MIHSRDSICRARAGLLSEAGYSRQQANHPEVHAPAISPPRRPDLVDLREEPRSRHLVLRVRADVRRDVPTFVPLLPGEAELATCGPPGGHPPSHPGMDCAAA